jgi:DNA modification methylase
MTVSKEKSQWRDRKIETRRMRVGDVLPHPMNPKIHPEGQMAPLRGLLETVGKLDDLKAYRSERAGGALVFFDGHGRQALDIDAEWDIDIYDLSDNEADLAVATFDPIGWQAEQSRVKLDELLREVSTGNEALLNLLTQQAEDAGIVPLMGSGGDQSDAEPQIDQAAELNEKWQVEPGDLWLIGEHRLLCGDSTKAKDVEQVMDGAKGVLMNTDPPYGIDYVAIKNGIPRSGFKNIAAEKGDIENDDLTDGASLQAFLEDAIRAAVPHLVDNAAFYLWHPMLTQGTFFAAAAAAADILIHRQIIWVKPGFVLTRSGMYHWKHELCFYGWRRGNPPPWYGDKSQTSVWEVGREGDTAHPTQKPVDLFIRPMMNHSKLGEVVYEPFAGSGSQFVAGQNIARRVFGLEISPKYCAVILERIAKAFPELEIRRG